MKPKRPIIETTAAAALLLLAGAFILVGAIHPRKIYDAEAEEFGMVAFMKLKGHELVVDATFTGVTRRDGRLYSTYDRSLPRGKRACPT